MKNKQTTNTILMIEPVAFQFNTQTATDNHFQHNDSTPPQTIQEKALQEFKTMVEKLEKHGIEVIVVKDTEYPHTPDSIFPNNWISFHEDGKIAIYPMYAPNRREERREDILDLLEGKGYKIDEVTDYTSAEEDHIFLEGTGSMVLDRANQIAYASLSERTDEFLFMEFCEDFEFTPALFYSTQNIDGKEEPVYHTNVLMTIAENFAILCLDSIKNSNDKKMVCDFLKVTNKAILDISKEQMQAFAGNMLQVTSKDKTEYLVMSTTAHQSLNQVQIEEINKYTQILVVDIPTIEKYGGGSVRCMMAEIFLQKND